MTRLPEDTNIHAQDAKSQSGPAQLQSNQRNLSPASTGLHTLLPAVPERQAFKMYFLGKKYSPFPYTFPYQLANVFSGSKIRCNSEGHKGASSGISPEVWIIWFLQRVHQRLSNTLIQTIHLEAFCPNFSGNALLTGIKQKNKKRGSPRDTWSAPYFTNTGPDKHH